MVSISVGDGSFGFEIGELLFDNLVGFVMVLHLQCSTMMDANCLECV